MRRETLLKIMGLFRKDLDKGLTILEISKKLKIGYRPAYNHIKAMSEQNIVTIEIVGRASQCFLNTKNEKTRHILEEVDMLRKNELFTKDVRLKNILESLIAKITQKFEAKIQSIVLFGSYAKEKATKGSDLDVLFIVSDMRDKVLRAEIERECASVQYSHNIKVSPLIADANEFRKMLRAEELNVGKEVREYAVSVYGYEQFWRLIA